MGAVAAAVGGGWVTRRPESYREKPREERQARAIGQQVGCGAQGPHLGATQIWFRRREQ